MALRMNGQAHGAPTHARLYVRDMLIINDACDDHALCGNHAGVYQQRSDVTTRVRSSSKTAQPLQYPLPQLPGGDIAHSLCYARSAPLRRILPPAHPLRPFCCCTTSAYYRVDFGRFLDRFRISLFSFSRQRHALPRNAKRGWRSTMSLAHMYYAKVRGLLRETRVSYAQLFYT